MRTSASRRNRCIKEMKQLNVRDASGNFVSTILAEGQAFLKWKRAWAKRSGFPARKVAIVIAIEKPPASMLINTGAVLGKLRLWLAEGETRCELVVRMPDREELPEQEVWQPWSAASMVK